MGSNMVVRCKPFMNNFKVCVFIGTTPRDNIDVSRSILQVTGSIFILDDDVNVWM